MNLITQRMFDDCFRCCVATILQVEYDEVPHFCFNENKLWYKDFEEWLLPRGLAPLMVFPDIPGALDDTFSIAGGPAARGLKHSVIYKGNDLFWDPHPSGEGLEEVKDFIFLIKNRPWS